LQVLVEYDLEVIATYLQVYEERAAAAKNMNASKVDPKGEEALRNARSK
jgi:hypothetical protein